MAHTMGPIVYGCFEPQATSILKSITYKLCRISFAVDIDIL